MVAMIFNKGFKCLNCGPMKTATKKAATKYLPARHICPVCSEVVEEWERPINERAGRCILCGHGAFKQAMGKGKLKGVFLVQCKKCEQVTNPDTKEVLKEGKEDFKYVVQD